MISPDLQGDATQKTIDLRDTPSSQKLTQPVIQAIPRHTVVYRLLSHLPKIT